jgi:glycerol 2-dehydrogenase (NADP+)
MSLPTCSKSFKLNDGRAYRNYSPTHANLNDVGYALPAVGLGTWQGKRGTTEDQKLKSNIIAALKIGYRHIDTARMYGVEHIVGSAIRESGIPRSEIFLVTKFWSDSHYDPESSLKESLEELGLEYVDLVSCLGR